MNVRLKDIFVAMVVHEPLELGGVEVAKEPGDAMKTIIDTDKLVEIMCTKVEVLLSQVQVEMIVGRRLQVVGIQHVGSRLLPMWMSTPSPNVFILKSRQVKQVSMNVKEFDLVLDTMDLIILVKMLYYVSHCELLAND